MFFSVFGLICSPLLIIFGIDKRKIYDNLSDLEISLKYTIIQTIRNSANYRRRFGVHLFLWACVYVLERLGLFMDT